jgi:hypothetical protein
MVYGLCAAVRRHFSYPLAGVFYATFFLPIVVSFRKSTQPAPSSPPATAFPLNCIRVPQRNYDHGRKQRNFKRLEPIYFSVGGRLGVNMSDAFRKIFTSLDGCNDPVLTDAAGAISCRLLVRSLHLTRLRELTPSQVSRISGQRQVMSGVSIDPVPRPRIYH